MSGIAAFINGGVQGINMRQQWDDRKRRQALEDERMGWTREDRQYTTGQRERGLDIQRRQDEDAASMRSVYEDGVARTNAAMDGQGGSGQPELGIIPQDAPIVETPLPPMGQDGQPPQAQLAPTDSPESVAYDVAVALNGDSGSPRERGVTRNYNTGELVYPDGQGPGGQLTMSPREMGATRDYNTGELVYPDAAVAGQGARLEQMRGAADRSIMQTEAPAAPQGPQAEQEAAAAEGYDLIQGGLPDNGRIYRHAETGQLAFASDGRRSNDQAEIQQMLDNPPAKTGNPVTGQQRPNSAAAQAAPPAPATASEQVAEAVVQQERSVAPNGNASTPVEVQRERATKSYMEMWNQEAMPAIIEEMLRTGRVEDARKFEEFMRSDVTQQGTELLGSMLFSANLGDLNGTLDAATEIYNLPGYYDDGYSVVRGQSGWAQDDQGNTTGINITFRNDQTGEVFMRNYAGQEDLIREVSRMFDPEQVFNEVASADTARAAQAKHEQSMELQLLRNQGRGGGADQGGITREAIDKAMKTLSAADGSLQGGFGSLPYEEQIQKAIDYINQRDAAMAAGMGTLGAVAGAPPVWRGE